ncbi:tRNA (adenosine(37)-N6)-threonylcarbamoyltransferase complex ATPase subunit type 1 TsaE [Atopobiaceae bacterium 24-176]
MGDNCANAGAAGLTRREAGTYVSACAEATQALGELLGGLLAEADLVILTGDLGAGKTQLTKGVARALGCAGDVTSPTFNIMVQHSGERLDLYHFDLYRLDDPDQLGDAGVLDTAGVEGASLVEWGEAFADELGDERLDVAISRAPVEGGAEPARVIEVRGLGERGCELAAALDAAVAGSVG